MNFNNIEEYKNLSGIYMIRNIVNDKIYIGATKSGFFQRYNRHNWELNKDIHHNDYLQKSYNKYGTDSFEFVILEVLENTDSILDIEKKYIKQYDSYNKGYNLTLGGEGFDGITHESRLKVGAANRKRLLGSKLSEETKRKMSIARKGRKLTEYQRQKLLESNINKIVSEETREKLSVSFQGSKSNFAILNEEQVAAIKLMIIAGVFDKKIADMYGVKTACISNIRYDYRWKHVIVDGWKEFQNKRPRKHTKNGNPVPSLTRKSFEG